ncbi:MAG: hypothetical protein GX639_21460 [Fibrobacter sp.]|nr:hypothetical protein [Fibrobacter sp.]
MGKNITNSIKYRHLFNFLIFSFICVFSVKETISQIMTDSLTGNTTSTIDTPKNDMLKSSAGVDLGIGSAYGLYGIGITWDTRKIGIALHSGIYRFPENSSIALKYNLYIEDAAVIFSPTVSFGYRNGTMVFYSWEESYFWGSVNLCFTNFFNKYFYLQNQIGIGSSPNRSIFLNYGICGGYQFGGTLFGAESYRKNTGFKILGFSLGTALAVLVGFIDLYITAMSND